MFFALGAILGLLLRRASFGRLGGLESLRLRGESAFIAVFLLSLALPALPTLLGEWKFLLFPLWVLLMASLAALCLMNRRAGTGFSLLAVGVLLNLAVIAANGAMPVSPVALQRLNAPDAALRFESDPFHDSASRRGRLYILADTIPVPGPVGLRSVQSVGDVLMLAAIVVIIASADEGALNSKHARVARMSGPVVGAEIETAD